MIHNRITVRTNDVKLRKYTETQIRQKIERGETFNGYLTGSKITRRHIQENGPLGLRVRTSSIDTLDSIVQNFTENLKETPELGTYPHYWQIENNPSNRSDHNDTNS